MPDPPRGPAHHDDDIRPADLRQAMGDQDGRAALRGAEDGALNLIFGGAVDRAGRVVEDQDARVGQKGARQGDPLALAARERHAALADDGLVAVGKGHDEVVGLRGAGGASIACAWRLGRPKAMFSATVRENRKMSCSMIEIWRRSAASYHWRTSTPSTSTAPLPTS